MQALLEKKDGESNQPSPAPCSSASFDDGVFCKPNVISLGTGTDLTGFNVHDTIGVQGQVFTIVNSDDPEYHKINRRVAGQRASKVLLLPLGAQPLPRLLELAASKAADS